MSAHQVRFPIATMCRLLGISPSGYYAWRDRPLSRRDKRVARLMRELGLEGSYGRRRRGTTRRDPNAQPAPDRIDRDFSAERPDQLWVGDIKYIPTRKGYLHLAVVVDAFSRRGGRLGDGTAPAHGVGSARPEHGDRTTSPAGRDHSDQGSQYTSISFGRRCREAGVRPSMGSRADCYDNALCESFCATLERELLLQHSSATRDEAERTIFEFIEGWYNPHRRHSALDYDSPLRYERKQTTGPRIEGTVGKLKMLSLQLSAKSGQPRPFPTCEPLERTLRLKLSLHALHSDGLNR